MTNLDSLVSDFIKESHCGAGVNDRKDFMEFLSDRGYSYQPRTLDYKELEKEVLAAYEVGSCIPNTSFKYKNARGLISEAKVLDINDVLPETDNTFVAVLSGHQVAHLQGLEIIRAHVKKTGVLLPVFSLQYRLGNGLTSFLYAENEWDAALNYGSLRALELVLPKNYVQANKNYSWCFRYCDKFEFLYGFAKRKGLKKVRYIIASGNPFDEAKFVSEFAYWLRINSADIDIEFVVSHLPLKLRPCQKKLFLLMEIQIPIFLNAI